MLEGGYYDTACTARHTLHIAENERCSNTVRLSCSSPCNNHGDICTEKLCEALRFVKVYLLVWLRHFAVYNEGTLQISRATYREKKTSIQNDSSLHDNGVGLILYCLTCKTLRLRLRKLRASECAETRSRTKRAEAASVLTNTAIKRVEYQVHLNISEQ